MNQDEAQPGHSADIEDLDARVSELAARLSRLTASLDRLAEAVPSAADHVAEATGPHPAPPGSLSILALDGRAYLDEVAEVRTWVDQILLPTYGREVTTAQPWCAQWHEHPEAVARLHALWLAWQQLTAQDAGLSGPSTWHRDHLDATLLRLRAPDGPFAACTTNPDRPVHRLLPGPATTAETS